MFEQNIPPKAITIQIDTREKYPLLFPKFIGVSSFRDITRRAVISVNTERIKLDIGDYRLKENPECVIERKASQLELYKNLCGPKDMTRQAKAFHKLSQVKYPYLLLEVTPRQLLATTHTELVPYPEALLQRLATVVARYGLNVIWAPSTTSSTSRTTLGTMLVHTMLACGPGSGGWF